MDQVAVDLDEVRAHLGDDEHARVPCAGIVDGDAKTAGAEVGDDASETRHVGHRDALTDLEDDGLGVDTGILGELCESLSGIRLRQSREHDVEEERRRQGHGAPGETCLNACLVEVLLHCEPGGIEQRARHLRTRARIDAA